MATDVATLSRYLADAHAAGLSLAQTAQALSDAGWTGAHLAALFEKTEQVAPVPPTDVIEVRGLEKRYGTFTAVDGISFSVRRGEIFGILGPNGAGKTTTLEMIEGLRSPTGGTISVNGLDVRTQTMSVKRIIGVQPQASSFLEGLTLTETLELFGALYGRTVDAAKLLADVQLTEKARQQVRELSGGQKQRFSIAVGLVNDPVVLFLDEPTTGLDPQARRNLWDLIRQINARGTTVVLTTHYMDEAEVLCDRIAVMDHAHIVALDTTQALLTTHGGTSAIVFSSTDSIPDGVLASLRGVRTYHADDGTHTLGSDDPRGTLDALFTSGRMHGFGIGELRMQRATLEDVFLHLTGHALRE